MKKPAKEGGMSVTMLIEFESNYDDIEVTFKEITGEFMHDTYEKISPRTDLDIRYEAVKDLQEAAKVSRGMKNGKATAPWGIPSELWKIVLNTNKVFTKQQHGIGHKGKFTIPAEV